MAAVSAHLIEMAGTTWGRWTVVARADKPKHWVCRCECGTTASVQGGSLRRGGSLSCGCGPRGRPVEHGRITTPEYLSWKSMIQRCCNPNATGYARYGGRGVVVCDRWRFSFTDFLADMGARPAGMSLDRIDVDGNYEPGNCRWATALGQRHNRRVAP